MIGIWPLLIVMVLIGLTALTYPTERVRRIALTDEVRGRYTLAFILACAAVVVLGFATGLVNT